jgi:hypothetical protein
MEASAPTSVSGLPNSMSMIQCGWHTVCASDGGPRVWCWGHNEDGAVGSGSPDFSVFSATRLADLPDDVVEVDAGGTNVCARLRSGELYCWGDNSSGPLGLGDMMDRVVPTPLPLPLASRINVSWLQMSTSPRLVRVGPLSVVTSTSASVDLGGTGLEASGGHGRCSTAASKRYRGSAGGRAGPDATNPARSGEDGTRGGDGGVGLGRRRLGAGTGTYVADVALESPTPTLRRLELR